MTRTNLIRAAPSVLVLSAALLVVGCAASVPVAPARAPVVAQAAPAPRAVSATAYAGHLARLASTDFDTRARANRALVAGGESALPALGRAGDMPVAVAGGMRVSATRPVVGAIMADLPRAGVERALRSPYANLRRAAAGELGRRDRWSAVPALIASLEDDHPEVRAAAAAALRRLTNNFFGFRAGARLEARREAAQRWRSWWSLEGRARAAERERGPSAAAPSGP